MQSATPPPARTPPLPLPIGEWMPDLPPLFTPGCNKAINVLPMTQLSYSPLQGLLPIGISGIAERVVGMFYFKDKDIGSHIFLGTATHLYHLFTHAATVNDASNPLEAYNASPDDPWCFTSYGEAIICSNGINQPQKLVIGDEQFSTMDIPKAKFVARVKDFLVLAFVTEISDDTIYPQRVHWSAIGNAELFPTLGTFEAAELQSDAQDLRSDLGVIQGLAANLQSADMAIFLDSAVYSSFYVGSPGIFSFQVAQGATGTRSPNSIISNHGFAYYLGTDGFYAFDGTTPRKIGAQKVDNFFYNDPTDGVDLAYITTVQGAADPNSSVVYWTYCAANSGGIPNRIIMYNWSLDRWSLGRISALWLAPGASMGYTLDELDQFGNLDQLQFSLDSPIWAGGQPALYAVDQNNNLASFGGANLEALIETTEEQPVVGYRSRVTSARPLVDGALPLVTLVSRVRLEDDPISTAAVPTNVFGACPMRVDSRYFRAQITIPAGSDWTHCQGVELSFSNSTRR